MIGCTENVDSKCINNKCTMVGRIPSNIHQCSYQHGVSLFDVEYCNFRLYGIVKVDTQHDRLALKDITIITKDESIIIPIVNNTNGEKIIFGGRQVTVGGGNYSFNVSVTEDFDKIRVRSDCDNVYDEKNKDEIKYC